MQMQKGSDKMRTFLLKHINSSFIEAMVHQNFEINGRGVPKFLHRNFLT